MNAMKNSCSKKSWVISVIAVTVFLCLFSFVVHQKLLAADYAATISLWRSKEEMDALGMYWPIYHFLIAIVAVSWFRNVCACRACCTKQAMTACCSVKSSGLCFGLKLGLIMGLGMSCSYLYMPIPFELAVKWFFAGLVQGVGIGVLLGLLCKGSSCGAGACGAENKA